ncbi:MAG: TolC family protein [Candidatus Sphingomonas colombiensis]|nr:TolC family protein [Sphingomonas sp.]WEK44796.1 MAG: TolC family protein [Sphingomonas sp.]
MRRAVLASAALLAGCVAGPNYERPDRAAANAPSAQGKFDAAHDPAFADAPLPDRWWRLYHDPLLDGLVTEALAANTDLRAADANLRAAAAVVLQTEAGRTVQTSVDASAGPVRPNATPLPWTGELSYSAGLSAALPLDLSGRIRRAIEASQADAAAVEAVRDEVRVTVAATTTRAYLAACAANLRIAAADRVLGVERQTYDVTRRLERGGRGTAFDTTRARAAVQQSEALVPTLVAQRQAALYQLATLAGHPPADYPRAVASCAALPALAGPLPVGDGAALLRRRPDIRAAERRLAASTARIGVVTASLYPQVSFGGSIGYTGPVSALGERDDFNFSLGPLMSWTFPNRRVVRAQITQAGANADAALAAFDGTVLGALRDVETALSAYARGREQVAALSRARDSAATATAQAEKLFRFGRGEFLNLLSAQATLANAEVSLAAAQAGVADTQAQLFLALGGGWGADEATSVVPPPPARIPAKANP